MTEHADHGPTGDGALAASRQMMLALLEQHVSDRAVIDAMAQVPRELFVPEHLRGRAYEDCALPIGEGQTISQPLMVALMLQAAQIKPTDRVLDIGTGSGYQAAVLSRLAANIVSVERIPELLAHARNALDAMGARNVELHVAGTKLGWAAGAPYDVIVVAAGAPRVPKALMEQLVDGGRLIVPVGDKRRQELMRMTRRGDAYEEEALGECAFVPLVGEDAWPGEGR